MKTFSAALIARLLEETASFHLLVAMDLALATERLTDMDVVWYYDGEAYTPTDIKLGQISSGGGLQVGTMEFSVQNVDQQMASHFLNDNQLGRTVTIRFTCLDDNRETIATPLLFRGLISTFTMTELNLNVVLKNELVLWKKRSLRKAKVMCQWPFKGTECGYAGTAATCDHTYLRCQALSNADNYGGFRWMAEMMEKEIFWGRK